MGGRTRSFPSPRPAGRAGPGTASADDGGPPAEAGVSRESHPRAFEHRFDHPSCQALYEHRFDTRTMRRTGDGPERGARGGAGPGGAGRAAARRPTAPPPAHAPPCAVPHPARPAARPVPL